MEGRNALNSTVYITRISTVTSLGTGVETLFSGLENKRSGIKRIKRFDTTAYAGPYAGLIDFPDRETKGPVIFKLADMLAAQVGPVDPDTFLIVASTKAGIDELDAAAVRTGTVPHHALLSDLTGYMAAKMGIRHRGININSACASSTIAVAKGAALIKSGAMDAVLVCCMDIVSEFVFSGFSALGAMSPEPASPFDINRTGLNLGEGGAAVMLMNERKAENLSESLLAQVTGWGIAGDAGHLTAPARDGSGLKRAVKKACAAAGVRPGDIHAVNTHGTGTVYNDAMELKVLHDLFDTKTVTANSIKGAIGHTLGAAGGIETALCVTMIQKGIMLPTAGLENPEQGAASLICREAQPLNSPRILTTNSGFGGINAALVIEGV